MRIETYLQKFGMFVNNAQSVDGPRRVRTIRTDRGDGIKREDTCVVDNNCYSAGTPPPPDIP